MSLGTHFFLPSFVFFVKKKKVVNLEAGERAVLVELQEAVCTRLGAFSAGAVTDDIEHTVRLDQLQVGFGTRCSLALTRFMPFFSFSSFIALFFFFFLLLPFLSSS